MWDPQHLTTVQASTVCYGDNLFLYFFFFLFYPSIVLPIFPSSCLAIVLTRILILIHLATDKHFELVYVGQRGLEWNTSINEKGEVFSTFFPAFRETSFRSLPILSTIDLGGHCSRAGRILAHPLHSFIHTYIHIYINNTYTGTYVRTYVHTYIQPPYISLCCWSLIREPFVDGSCVCILIDCVYLWLIVQLPYQFGHTVCGCAIRPTYWAIISPFGGEEEDEYCPEKDKQVIRDQAGAFVCSWWETKCGVFVVLTERGWFRTSITAQQYPNVNDA
jgi:hypothetical protein